MSQCVRLARLYPRVLSIFAAFLTVSLWSPTSGFATTYNCEIPGQLPQTVTNLIGWGAANVPASNCTDGIRTRVYSPLTGAVSYELSPSNCDPSTQSCTVIARVGVSTPGNSQNNQTFDSIVKVLWFNSGGGTVGRSKK